jgi:hypothetical protein
MKTPIRRRAAGALASAALAAGGVLVAPATAHAAWGTTYNVSIQVSYNGLSLGRADGWVQFDDGGSSFRYSLAVCRQSSYARPGVEVAVNAGYVGSTWQETPLEYKSTPNGSPTTPTPPCYGDTWLVTGQDTYTTRFSNVEFVLFGSTFAANGAYTTVSRKYVGVNPY